MSSTHHNGLIHPYFQAARGYQAEIIHNYYFCCVAAIAACHPPARCRRAGAGTPGKGFVFTEFPQVYPVAAKCFSKR